jgi:hypothetical protein
LKKKQLAKHPDVTHGQTEKS